MHDTKTPVLVGATAMGINAGLSFAFAFLFNQIGWMPHGGLALANTLATTLETITLLIIMRKRLKGIQGRDLVKGAGAAILGTLGMSAVIILWLKTMQAYPAALVALGGVILGGIFYLLIIILLRRPGNSPGNPSHPAKIRARLNRSTLSPYKPQNKCDQQTQEHAADGFQGRMSQHFA